MAPTKALSEREKELQSMLTTPTGREGIRQLESRYQAASGRERPARTSIITYIIVHERELGLIRS
jgi:hypothetical protein